MDDLISRGIMFGDYPPKGVYFTVVVEYNHTNPIFNGEMPAGSGLMSNPVESFPKAMDLTDKLAKEMNEDRFPDSIVRQLDPEESNGYHMVLVDKNEDMLACFKIDTHDHRDETLH